jgi:aldose 1-epimerase
MTTGEMMAVTETPFDFNTPKTIAPDVTNFENEQIKFGNGFDHNWVLNTKGDINQLAAKLTSPTSGITLEVYTNEPGIQVYTGNFLDGTVKGKKGITYLHCLLLVASVCLFVQSAIPPISQHYPDSPNKSQWPSVILEPGQTYHSQCIFKFGVEK